eukprot:GHVU01168625.1.p1 GENE.GHVU01168625.1~~GHVU01168625.1.p1  ORF type:complete len:178 (+),score=45.55 GHVU01168625.1:100-633(+)
MSGPVGASFNPAGPAQQRPQSEATHPPPPSGPIANDNEPLHQRTVRGSVEEREEEQREEEERVSQLVRRSIEQMKEQIMDELLKERMHKELQKAVAQVELRLGEAMQESLRLIEERVQLRAPESSLQLVGGGGGGGGERSTLETQQPHQSAGTVSSSLSRYQPLHVVSLTHSNRPSC